VTTVSGNEEPGGVRAVTRALALLKAVQGKGSTLTDLAADAGIPRPTALRLVRTLEAEGFLTRTDGMYVLGPAIAQLRLMPDPDQAMRFLVHEALTDLRDTLNESCAYWMLYGTRRICVDTAESRQSVRWQSRLGIEAPLHLGAGGKVLTAFSDTEQILAAVPTADGKFTLTDGRVRSLDDLRREMGVIRRRGYATSKGESTSEAWGAAVPVFVHGSLAGTVTVIMPSSRRYPVAELIAACKETVERLQGGADLPAAAAPGHRTAGAGLTAIPARSGRARPRGRGQTVRG
jgi:DNA-binding IclR family transcriptional regulator